MDIELRLVQIVRIRGPRRRADLIPTRTTDNGPHASSPRNNCWTVSKTHIWIPTAGFDVVTSGPCRGGPFEDGGNLPRLASFCRQRSAPCSGEAPQHIVPILSCRWMRWLVLICRRWPNHSRGCAQGWPMMTESRRWRCGIGELSVPGW